MRLGSFERMTSGGKGGCGGGGGWSGLSGWTRGGMGRRPLARPCRSARRQAGADEDESSMHVKRLRR